MSFEHRSDLPATKTLLSFPFPLHLASLHLGFFFFLKQKKGDRLLWRTQLCHHASSLLEMRGVPRDPTGGGRGGPCRRVSHVGTSHWNKTAPEFQFLYLNTQGRLSERSSAFYVITPSLAKRGVGDGTGRAGSASATYK